MEWLRICKLTEIKNWIDSNLKLEIVMSTKKISRSDRKKLLNACHIFIKNVK